MAGLDGGLATVEGQIVQLLGEMRSEFSTVRAEKRELFERARAEARTDNNELRVWFLQVIDAGSQATYQLFEQ